jgi:hypothetical protein
MKTPLLKLFIAWIVVILPLGWGVFKSAVKSRPLFQPVQVSGAR